MASTNYSSAGRYLFTVPAGVTSMTATIWGGIGGGTGLQGNGGQVQATFVTVPGQIIYVYVGGNGAWSGASAGGAAGGFNGGGAANPTTSGGSSGGGGGGATDLRIGADDLAHRILVAGGGGGQCGSSAKTGGAGGAATGAAGQNGTSGTGGGGGTAAAGGAAGTAGGSSSAGTAGALGVGGIGGSAGGTTPRGGGGGGGGNYGGGGGGGDSAVGSGSGGGGGSNLIASNINGSAPTSTSSIQGGSTGFGSVSLTYDLPPNAPTLTAPLNANIDTTAALAFSWLFSDSDPGDTQTSADFQWRVGSGAWTTSTGVASTAQTFTASSGTWTAYVNQRIEYQIRTTDAAGPYVGPWSASGFFTPRTPPTAPTITPTPTIVNNTPTVSWTTPSTMVAYQVRVMNDVAGSPGSTVITDSGTVGVSGNPTAKTATLPSFTPSSGTKYHIQVRYQQFSGVWSTYTDSGAITANINAPLVPTLALSPNNATASVTINITNPGSDPHPPSYNDVFRTNLDTGDPEIRVATGVALNGVFTDFLPGANTNYRYRVNAVTGAGAFTSSA